ncbi:MAG: universal stress protein [Actinomycetota bacterium]
MTERVDAFVEDSPEAAEVLQMALSLADVFSVEAEALHVGRRNERLARLAESENVLLRTVAGDPTQQIIAEMDSPGVVMGVLGCRQPAGPRPGGHVALQVIARVARVLAVVPPGARLPSPGEIRRILVPLDGSRESALAVRELCDVFARSNIDVVVVHVFDRETVPSFWDQPHYAAEAWGEEFRAQFLESASIRLRTGEPYDRILAVASEEAVDAIALGWSQRLDPGRARVVRHMLSESPVPVLLVPVGEENPL